MQSLLNEICVLCSLQDFHVVSIFVTTASTACSFQADLDNHASVCKFLADMAALRKKCPITNWFLSFMNQPVARALQPSLCPTSDKRTCLQPILNKREANWSRNAPAIASQGQLLGMCRSAFGQFFPCPYQQSQKSLRQLTSPTFLLVSKVTNSN